MSNKTEQKPINSVFSAESTTEDVIRGIDLSGKIALVTGGYAGLGLETVKTLVKAGAEVVVPARDKTKATTNLQGVKNVTIETMNLMEPVSISEFADRFLEKYSALHILINNAGIM